MGNHALIIIKIQILFFSKDKRKKANNSKNSMT